MSMFTTSRNAGRGAAKCHLLEGPGVPDKDLLSNFLGGTVLWEGRGISAWGVSQYNGLKTLL